MAIAAVAIASTACSESLPTEAAADLTPSYAKGETSGNKLQCFGDGECTLIPGGATLSNDAGEHSGVYIPSNLIGRSLSDVNKLSFDYSGSGAAGGSPRISVPIDSNGDGTTDDHAFIDTGYCNDAGDPNVGTLDAINDPTCVIWYGSDSYANWAAFASANPTYRISGTSFIIVDQAGTFNITNVQLGKGPAKGK